MSVSPLTLADAARIVRDAVRDKSYRATPLGEEVGRFLRYMRAQELAPRSRQEYESVLYRLARYYADLQLSDLAPPVGTERVEKFVDEHWGTLAPGTRRKVLSILASFFQWAHERDRIPGNPMTLIRRPKRRRPDRHAHMPREVMAIVACQPLHRDRAAILLLGKIGLRKNELRLLRIRDIDLERGTVRLNQKGGDIVTHPIAFPDVLQALGEHFTLDGRQPDEYLLYPRWERTVNGETIVMREARERPMSPRGVHEWWSRCLVRAEVPHFPMHELRHTAGTEFHRAGHDLKRTQMFMRHKSITTTADVYMDLDQNDLIEGMRAAYLRWQEQTEEDE